MGKDLTGKELGEGLSQRKDGRYQGRYVDRFGNRKCVYGATLREAKNNLAQAQKANVLHANVINEKTTLDEWYSKWMEVYKIPVIRRSSKIYYEGIYKKFISPQLGKEKLVDLTKLKVTRVLNKEKEEGYSWGTLNKTKLLLVDMLNKALEDDFVYKNVAKGIVIPIRRTGYKKVKALSVEEQESFFECAMGTFYYPAYVVAINTGLRPGELFALTEDDIDFSEKVIHVTKTLTYQTQVDGESKEFLLSDPKTKTSVRDIPINDICMQALLKQKIIHHVIRQRKNSKDTPYPELLFTTKFGTPLNVELFNEGIRRVIEEINFSRDELDQMDKFGGHTFRHTFATRCFEAGIPPKTVQTYLGHATLKMTMDLYTSVMPVIKQQEMYKLEASIGITPPSVEEYIK